MEEIDSVTPFNSPTNGGGEMSQKFISGKIVNNIFHMDINSFFYKYAEVRTKLQSSEETLEKRDCGRENIFQCLSSECKDIGLDMLAECITHTNANKLMCVKDLELIVEQTYKH
uniref:Uncharacterized protein n=1 Tax=Glossina austeni TaxID=7395 RepID=A0A1A9VFV3_GLOAU